MRISEIRSFVVSRSSRFEHMVKQALGGLAHYEANSLFDNLGGDAVDTLLRGVNVWVMVNLIS